MGGLGALATTAKIGLTWSRWVWPGWWPRRSDDRDRLDMLQEGMALRRSHVMTYYVPSVTEEEAGQGCVRIVDSRVCVCV